MKSCTLLFAAVFACGMLPAAAQPVANSTTPAPAALAVPTGFGVSVFASGLTGARLMAVSPDGRPRRRTARERGRAS